jgi:high-affinity iron transporter
MFRPRVQVMRTGESLTIENADATLVNFHITSARNQTLNMALPGPGSRDVGSAYSAKPGIARVKDDVHVWPAAFIHVVDGGEHRVTKHDGAFRFDGLPPGRYRLEVWHESGKKDSREVALEPGKPIKLEVELR